MKDSQLKRELSGFDRLRPYLILLRVLLTQLEQDEKSMSINDMRIQRRQNLIIALTEQITLLNLPSSPLSSSELNHAIEINSPKEIIEQLKKTEEQYKG